jgi:hypothetical protein
MIGEAAKARCSSGQRSAKASREANVNKWGRTSLKNADHSREARHRTSFGTRGSQVQILPLRPSLLPFQVISIRAKRSAPLRWALFAPGVLRALRDQLRRYKLVDASLSRDRPRLPMAICFFRSVWPAGDSFQGDLSLWRSFLRSVWLAGDSFLRGSSLWCGTSILWGRFSGRISQFLGEGYWQ